VRDGVSLARFHFMAIEAMGRLEIILAL